MSQTSIFLKNTLIFPLLIMLLGKISGLFFAINTSNINFSVQRFLTEFSSLNLYFSIEEIQTINTFSDIFMYFFLFLATSLVTLGLLNKKRSKKEKVSIKTLAHPSFINLLKDTTALYSTLINWVVILVLATVWIVFNYIRGNSSASAVLISVICTSGFSLLITLDVFLETRAIRLYPKRYQHL